MPTRSTSPTMRFLEGLAGGHLNLGDLLLSIRLGEELSQAEFARHLGVSRSHLCDIEKGRKSVGPRRAAKFARVLGYSEAQFVRLALQGLIEDAGLDFRVQLEPAAAR
jgi:transcriptional regulator with XRE-family HTH domain